MTLIRREDGGAAVSRDSWVPLEDDATVPAEGDVIVPLARWEADAELLRQRKGRVGVRVSNETDPDALGEKLDGVALVAVEFPKYTDGRGYSIARVLRERHAFDGELRAVGNVLRDQLFYMARCGFDAFELEDGKSVDDAIAAFRDFSVTYQPASDHDAPIWKRRRA